MLNYFYLLVIAVCLPCIYYLLMSAVEKEEFFLTRNIARWIYPHLDRRERHQKLQYIAGILMALLALAGLIAFVTNRFGRG